ncbi:MAG: hypothetical protein H6720_05740 [Sandaracinus sp.]|nr:hypothetical protein [Sandaracinus sp.]
MRRKQRHLLASVAAIAGLAALVGCSDRELRPLNPCTVQGVAESVKVDNIEEVDLLFMIDNSNSMAQEQNALSRELPNLVRVLASGDIEGDGTQEFPPVRSLQVGVVTSDMGTGGFIVPTCSNSRFGDDGVLRDRGNTARPGCMAMYSPRFFSFEPAGGGDPTAFANEVTCVAAMGTNGCGFEQQLEAVLKAVTPSTSGIRFVEGSVGHADGQNAGFIRPNSLLTVIVVTDEEDCSAVQPEVFDPASTTFGGDLNLRCWTYGDPAMGIIHPVQRFVDGLLATRADPDLLVVAAITGVPEAVNPTPGAPIDYAAILAHPDMVEMVDPTMPSRLRPSCDRTDEAGERSIAFPPRRIVSMLQGLEAGGANAILQTICQDSFTGALEAVVRKIADVLGGTCLPRALVRGAGDIVNCDVVEQLAPGRSCAEFPGRTLRETVTDTVTGMAVEVCQVEQLPVAGEAVPAGDGWYYDDFSADVAERCSARPQRIAFTQPPATGTTVRLECLQTIGNMGGGVGSECGAEGCPSGLSCDGLTNTCQPTCETNADCAGGFVCWDFRSPSEACTTDGDCMGVNRMCDPATFSCKNRVNFCVNPTCD